jgi:C1A family cysteine protease
MLAAPVLAFAGVVTATSDASYFNAWENFKVDYGKKYSEAEEAYRFSVFKDNVDKANKQNAEHILASGEAVFGITKFSDLTVDEFRTGFLNYRPRDYTNVTRITPVVDGPIANDIDWRNNGAVTPVKDQGQCGSCWAFGATAAIESYGQITGTYSLQVLAPQQITSCDTTSYGCQGGWAEHAFNYVTLAGGIQAESTYPYVSGTTGQTGSCKADPSKFVAKITGYKAVSPGESNLEAALNTGPPTVCLAATAFQTYTGGILTQCDNQVDHCVQAVGYTSSYWIVRNSWGTGWGEAGYIRIARGSDLCMISDDVTFPTFV